MAKTNQTNKICAACGLSKSLSAFLQINSPQGTTNGNICPTCRGSGHGKQVTIPQNNADEEGGSASGLKINAKTKVQMEVDKKQQGQRLKDLAQKEAKKRQTATNEKGIFTEIKENLEKKHRTEYIEPKKQKSFLDYQRQKPGAQESTGTSREGVTGQATLDKSAITELNRQQQEV